MNIKVIHILGDENDVIVHVDEQCYHPDTYTKIITDWDGYDYQVTRCVACDEELYHEFKR